MDKLQNYHAYGSDKDSSILWNIGHQTCVSLAIDAYIYQIFHIE